MTPDTPHAGAEIGLTDAHALANPADAERRAGEVVVAPDVLAAVTETADYLIDLYKRLWRGGAVRDLQEAISAYDAAKRTAWNTRTPDARLTERVARLEAALRPFAVLGKMLDGPFAPALFPDDRSAGIGKAWSENGEPRYVTFGHLRAARAALADGGSDR